MSEGVLVVDASERILFVNEKVKEYFPTLAASVVGRPLFEAVRIPGILDLLSHTRQTGQKEKKDVRLYHARGEVVLEVQSIPFVRKKQEGIMLLLHDITELSRLEATRKDFLANASHEMRTPLAAMKGYVETLLDGGVKEEETRLRFLQKLLENVNRLTALTDDLLSISRIAASVETPFTEALSAQKVLTESAEQYRSLAERKGLTINCMPLSEDLFFQGNPRAVSEILDNLVDNAIKYSNKGEIRLSAKGDGKEIHLMISDQGIGIVKSEQERIFERFYRVDKAHSRSVGGTGLGLSIVKHLTEQMNGSIRVESEPGVGSRFIVTLPKA